VPEESPAHHVRDLRFSTGGCQGTPPRFFVVYGREEDDLVGAQRVSVVADTFFGGLQQSVTSLTIDIAAIALTQIRDVLMQVPSLDDLSLSGFLDTVERNTLPGMGTVLRGGGGLVDNCGSLTDTLTRAS
jgi:hypothetical protein